MYYFQNLYCTIEKKTSQLLIRQFIKIISFTYIFNMRKMTKNDNLCEMKDIWFSDFLIKSVFFCC